MLASAPGRHSNELGSRHTQTFREVLMTPKLFLRVMVSGAVSGIAVTLVMDQFLKLASSGKKPLEEQGKLAHDEIPGLIAHDRVEPYGRLPRPVSAFLYIAGNDRRAPSPAGSVSPVAGLRVFVAARTPSAYPVILDVLPAPTVPHAPYLGTSDLRGRAIRP